MDFYEDFRKLVYSRPHVAVSSRAVENCNYGDYIYRSKNIYLGYFLTDSQDCYYCDYMTASRDCVDCCYVAAGELCYECTDCSGLYNCSFLQDCHNCSYCDFCLDCLNCKDCFGCSGLRHQQFCMFNKPHSEEEYRQKIIVFKKNPSTKTLEILRPEFDKHPRLYARLLKGGENSHGDYIYFSKNCHQCFNVRYVEDSAYVADMMNMETTSRDCFDCDFVSNAELCYECQATSSCHNCNFLAHSASCSDCEYLLYCYNCINCFGCVYMRNKQYCILNRQFSRDEYFAAINQIKNDLKKAGAYGKSLADVLK